MKITKNIQIRYLQVYVHHSSRGLGIYCINPQIRLCGLWLKNAGFKVGDKIKIVVSKKCLVIVPDEEKQEGL